MNLQPDDAPNTAGDSAGQFWWRFVFAIAVTALVAGGTFLTVRYFIGMR